MAEATIERPLMPALRRGVRRKCPRCGEAPAFSGYLRITKECASCGLGLGEIRADDFPPYVTIFLVGHIIVPLLLLSEKQWAWPMWLHMAVWPAATLVLTLAFLPFIKGAVLGLMWSLKLRGDEFQ